MTNQKKTLLVLAAGMGSRYGGLKQLDEVGPSGETIIDYSIYDALHAGFNKLVFIIRDEFRDEFQEKITNKFRDKAEMVFVNQAINTPIEGIDTTMERTKPWGTGHAVLVAKNVIHEPFAVVNADDFYGRDAFVKAFEFLDNEVTEFRHGIIGYILKNTLSENGYVSRGVCQTNAQLLLTAINERTKIQRVGAEVQYEDNGVMYTVDENSIVSMNFWVFHHSVFQHLHHGFRTFVANNKDNPKAEYFIPLVADELIREGEGEFVIRTSNAKWFGVTYREDKPDVMEELATMTRKNIYPSPLF